MSRRLKRAKLPGREFEEVRELDPDGRIVAHHRTVDSLGRMLKAGTISPEMYDAAQDFQADFIVANLGYAPGVADLARAWDRAGA